MNKTLTALGVGIWGVMLFLGFILRASLGQMGLTCQQITDTLFPLTVTEIFAFVLAVVGLIKNN